MEPLLYLSNGEPSGLLVGEQLGLAATRATFYAVWRADGQETGFLYKELHDMQWRPRVDHLVRYCHAQGNLRNALAGVPVAALKRADGSYGVLLRGIAGVDLTDMRPIVEANDLRLQLQIGLDLASEVALLHHHGLVHGDISGANILYDLSAGGQPRIDLVDMDMAAVWEGEAWAEGLSPVQVPPPGPYQAPELVADMARRPTIWTDRWGLAVALHFILCRSNPLAVVGLNSNDYAAGRSAWPPATPRLKTHSARFEALGSTLQHYFIQTFDTQWGFWPERRITATDWAKAIAAEMGLT